MENIIKDYIERNIPELRGRLCPVFTTDISKLSVAYKFTPLSGGHLCQSQLELKIIDGDYDSCKEIEGKLTMLLDMEEDVPFMVDGAIKFHSAVAGGGILLNEGCQRFEDTLYFMIDWRKIDVI